MAELRKTPLHDLHVELGARMVPFAGWEMPVQYPSGVMAEHRHTRAKAGLFDVSHMGQLTIRPPAGGGWEEVAAALETVLPQSVLGLKDGRQRYGFLTNDQGGIIDDLMFARRGDHAFVVVNAARCDVDLAHLARTIGAKVTIEPLRGRALLALQGPSAEAALARLSPEVAGMRFMDVRTLTLDVAGGVPALVSRSGYTGEDGFEISLPAESAETVARALLDMEEVAPIGLGARDSLRLEAGLCLYGNDIDETTTPVEAALEWAIQKPRRRGGDRAGGFPGAEVILAQLEAGAPRRRVGLLPEGRAPMRQGTPLRPEGAEGAPVGTITSGGFGPTAERPVAMGYVPAALAAAGTRLEGEVRGKWRPVAVADLPFVPHRYRR